MPGAAASPMSQKLAKASVLTHAAAPSPRGWEGQCWSLRSVSAPAAQAQSLGDMPALKPARKARLFLLKKSITQFANNLFW